MNKPLTSWCCPLGKAFGVSVCTACSEDSAAYSAAMASVRTPKMISVDADALRQLLDALSGPGHHIRELQATRNFPPNPINTLIDQYQAWSGTRP